MARRIRVYTDEHIPIAVVAGLRRRGVEVRTCQDAGLLGADDGVHLQLACEQGWVILTQDADFLRLHAAGVSHCGLIYCHRQSPIGAVIRGVMLVYELLDAEEMVGHLEFV